MSVDDGAPKKLVAADIVAGQLAAEAAYRDVKAALDTYGIDSIVLKGPHLGAVAYENASQRPYTDLDLLVPAARFDEAASAVSELGYEFNERPIGRYLQSFQSPQGWPVELHNAFEAYMLFRVDYEGLFERAEPFMFGQIQAKGLAREDLLAHLVIHAAKSLFREISYKHIVDVGMVASGPLDWDVFLARVTDYRCRTASWILLSAARSESSTGVPEGVLAQLRPSWIRRAWLRLWLTQNAFPIFRWGRLPNWFGRLVVGPGIVDRVGDGIASSFRFAAVRARDVFR